MHGEIRWECPYNQQLCSKYSYNFVNLGFKLHYTGVEICATCQMQQKLGRFPLQRVAADTTDYLGDKQTTPATSTY